MPFGAESRGEGRSRFRLWAPSAKEVALVLGARALPMTAQGDGWWQRVEAAPAGTRYRYRIDGAREVPDPASRFNPDDVHGPSEVVAPEAFDWPDGGWRGRPWEEAALYEMHVGAFSPEGTFAGVEARLGDLARLGVTAIELMPVADFAGRRNWGYDGVLPFAPDATYGRPEDLKRLIAAAHARGLMVFLDVVYNHFGPEGNYLHHYARPYFSEGRRTPWGAAINFDGPGSRTVREFFIHNALYWLEEFHVDGLRLDAVHAIADDSAPGFLAQLALAVRDGPGRVRHVHLVLENDDNAARYLERTAAGQPRWYDAQWNDDAHHALHVLLTGERDGYYADYRERPAHHLGRSLAEGFAYQGEQSAFRGRRRGERSRGLPATAFVNFLQNHDQVGNRALGERLAALTPPEALRAAAALLLMAPPPPLLFMGEEFGCTQPFPFFCDFGPDLARAVREGRCNEFRAFARFCDAASRAVIPDPGAESTFAAARLDWGRLERPECAAWLAFYRELLAARRERIVPLLPRLAQGGGRYELLSERALRVEWRCVDGATLAVTANLGPGPVAFAARAGEPISAWPASAAAACRNGRLEPWSVVWQLCT